jgi:uncharacterized protein (TIGR03000 family)
MPTTKFLFVAGLAAVALLFGSRPVQAQHHHGGGGGGAHFAPHYGGAYHGYGGYGLYRPYGFYPYGYYPYGWYRPYYPVVGIGIGFYVPYYGSYAYPVAPAVIVDGSAGSPPVVANAPPGNAPPPGTAPDAPPANKPPPDNAGHLQLKVPENAEVFVDGVQITQSGPTREIISPPVKVGTRYTYKISVRYTDAQGKAVNDTRDINFQANDWFSIDFTRPAPPMANPPPPTVELVPLKEPGK